MTDENPEKAALHGARIAAAAIIGNTMHQGSLRTFQKLLSGQEACEQHRFAAMIEWAMKLIEHDAILDKMGVSRATLRRWASAETTPVPLARVSVLNRLEELVKERLGG